jgi:hypothetical protein
MGEADSFPYKAWTKRGNGSTLQEKDAYNLLDHRNRRINLVRPHLASKTTEPMNMDQCSEPDAAFKQQMLDSAAEAVHMAKDVFGHELDYSEASLGAVEVILGLVAETIDRSDTSELKHFATIFGAYVGEVTRKVYPDAIWRSSHPDYPGFSPFLDAGHLGIFPCSWCFKRLYSGAADAIPQKYITFRRSMQEPNPNEPKMA